MNVHMVLCLLISGHDNTRITLSIVKGLVLVCFDFIVLLHLFVCLFIYLFIFIYLSENECSIMYLKEGLVPDTRNKSLFIVN